MTTLIDRKLRMQRQNIKESHGKRFFMQGMEYRIVYDGGVGEYVSVYGRRGSDRFRFINGFYAYMLHTADEVISTAKKKVFKP